MTAASNLACMFSSLPTLAISLPPLEVLAPFPHHYISTHCPPTHHISTLLRTTFLSSLPGVFPHVLVPALYLPLWNPHAHTVFIRRSNSFDFVVPWRHSTPSLCLPLAHESSIPRLPHRHRTPLPLCDSSCHLGAALLSSPLTQLC